MSVPMHGRFVNPVLDSPHAADHGDPFVLRHNGEYLLFHTTDDGRRPVSVHRSRDLVAWELVGEALAGGPPGAQTDLWAPEVLRRDATWKMYVAATRRVDGGAPDPSGAGEGVDAARRQWLATAGAPGGPYAWEPEPLLDTWAIDGHPFLDEDGALWLFYNVHSAFLADPAAVGLAATGTGILVDRLVGDARLEGRPVPAVVPSQPWESNHAGTFRWNEGPWVLKRRGLYFLMYSGGNYRESTYGLGLATATDPRGPWHKDPLNPILGSGRRITGPGHHCVVLAPDGVTPYAVYHGYVAGSRRPGPGTHGGGRKIHIDRLRWAGARPHIGRPEHFPGLPTEDEQPLPPPPVHEPAVAHWNEEVWMQGSAVSVGGLTVEFPDGLHRVQATSANGRLDIRVDGVLGHRGPAAPPPVTVRGDVLHRARTSHLSDEQVHDVGPYGRVSWDWGGSGPVEVCVAIRGAATVRVGGEVRDVFSPADRYDLVTVVLEDGAARIEVEAGPQGARVADLFVAARPPGWGALLR